MVGLFALFMRFLLILLIPGLIVGLVLLIVFSTKRKKPNASEQAPSSPEVQPAPQIPTEQPISQPVVEQPVSPAPQAPQAPPKTKVFVDGGRPAYGDSLGRITIDGRSLAVLYSELPIEINLPVGNHHVVVEGGHVGDARIDRFIELGVNDVWTVDLPGGDDADLIRHQIIHISEYRNAISVSGYRVNKKYL